MKLYGCKQGFRLERDQAIKELGYTVQPYSDPGWGGAGMASRYSEISMVVFCSPWIFTNSNMISHCRD